MKSDTRPCGSSPSNRTTGNRVDVVEDESDDLAGRVHHGAAQLPPTMSVVAKPARAEVDRHAGQVSFGNERRLTRRAPHPRQADRIDRCAARPSSLPRRRK